LCHGDGGPTNFIMNAKGTYLIDFETLRLDLRSYDLYRVIHNSCKDHRWDFEIARAILDGYQSVSKLNETDFRLLKVWTYFPREVFKLLSRYDRSRNRTDIEKELSIVIQQYKLKDELLRQLDRYSGMEGLHENMGSD